MTVPSAEAATCVATEVITSEHKPVGYLYRTPPATPGDSGWRFMTGKESEKYMNQPKHYITCRLADIVRDHPELAALLDAPAGSAFERGSAGGFVAVEAG